VAWYHALTSRVTFAARVRGGFITVLPPQQERLFAGGATSVRGFQQNELGPVIYLVDSSQFTIKPLTGDSVALIAKPGARDTRTIPVGGNTLLVMNAELRLRDPFFPDAIQYVPFLDAGEVWTRETGVRGLNLDQLAVTPGLGLRYSSPVGPIQLNAGYNPAPPRGGQGYWAVPVNTLTNKAPLLCVTRPDETPVPVILKDGQFDATGVACPGTFAPFRSSNFFKRLTVTLSMSTSF
jgi:outer membrane protein insertion porin family